MDKETGKSNSKGPGTASNATGKTNSTTLKCCKHFVIVEFRPLKAWQGEFGFDWLRVYEGKNIPGLYVVGKGSSDTINYGEELPYIDAEGHKDNKHLGYVTGGSKVSGKWPPADAGEFVSELTESEAKKEIRKEYGGRENKKEMRSFKIERKFHSSPYRILEYFVPYLTFFPSFASPPLYDTVNGYHLTEDVMKSLPTLPKGAWLQVLVDIKHNIPDLIVLEYDPDLLFISSKPGGDQSLRGKYILPKPYAVTGETYEDSVQSKARIFVSGLKPLREDAVISAYAYTNDLKKKAINDPIGKMIVRANDNDHQRTMKIALVKVHTKGLSEAGSFTQKELTRVCHILHQALIIPDFVNRKRDGTLPFQGHKNQLTLDLREDPEFKAGGKFINPKNQSIVCDANGFGEYLQKLMKKAHPELSSHCFVFSFAQKGQTSDGKEHAGYTHNSLTTRGYKFHSLVTLYPLRFEYDAGILAHELLHTLGLGHTIREIKMQAAQKYTFKTNNITTNIMSSNFGSMWSTSKWQWEIMSKNAQPIKAK
jgi:hypothetical protein